MTLDAELRVSHPSGFRLELPLRVEPGHTAALLGPNGAGKSTAVAALAGLVPLDAGRIALGGRVLDDPARGVFVPPEQRRLGVVFQDYALFPHLSVADNVAFGLRSRGVARTDAAGRVAQWLERLELAELADRRPRELSGGQAQRVALARALITEPALLLLDEPLAALDVATRARLRHTLSDHLADYAGPRLLITHDPTEAFLLADAIHVLEDGVVTQSGPADDIRLRPRTPYIAELAGANLLQGQASAGVVRVGDHPLHIADSQLSGPVLARVQPRAVALHRQRPDGSPRNSWLARVQRIEHYGERVRLQLGGPLPLVAEVTPQALRELELRAGADAWVSLKATEIDVEADPG